MLDLLRHCDASLEARDCVGGCGGDPVTGNIRQFDIRAFKDEKEDWRRDLPPWTLALAVECKNIRPHYPLLLSAVPRTTEEAFHDLLVLDGKTYYPHTRIQRVKGSVYKEGEMVAKQTDQVHWKNENLESDDEATFGKIRQALNSCEGLVRNFATKLTPPDTRMILPLLVVPSGTLWQVDFTEAGELQTPPRLIESSTLFLNHGWTVNREPTVGPITYQVSHLELVSQDALPKAAERWKNFFVE